MSYQINQTQLQQFAPRAPAGLADACNAAMAKYGIDQSPRRVRYFMAQSAFETSFYTAFVENLNYTTPERLCAVWPSRFTMNQSACTPNGPYYAPNYVNNPQALANLTYANRNGNGDVSSGDGWAFRGHGGFNMTGRGNFAAYDAAIYGDGHIVANPDLVAQPVDAMLSAAYFWNANGLGPLADTDSYTEVTHRINGAQGSALVALVQQRLPALNQANSIFTW
jgi:putative chitinase